MNTKRPLILTGILILIILSAIGWFIFFTQKPDILTKARLKYLQAKQNNLNLENGPCLGKIADDWVLDIAHVPRQTVDDLPQNQCPEYQARKVHHYVEMSPKGEIIVLH